MEPVATPTGRSDAPTRPARMRCRVVDVGDRVEITWSSRHGCIVLFLSVWLTGWTVGCVALFGQLLVNFQWFMLLFATPFFAAEVFVFGLVMWMVFGRERLVLDRHEVAAEKRVLSFARRRAAALDTVVTFEGYEQVTDSEDNTVSHGIQVTTAHLPLRFGLGLPDEERLYLIDLLNRRFAEFAPLSAPEVRRSMSVNLQPSAPVQLRFSVEEELDGLRIVHPGQWSASTIAGTTFIMLFWNGIVGVFLVQLIKEFQWLLFLFLIPFEVIGLLIAVGWFAAVLGPMVQRQWRLTGVDCTRSLVVLGVHFSRSVDAGGVLRVELADASDASATVKMNPIASAEGGRNALRFVGRADHGGEEELFRINGVTDAEADLLLDAITRRFPQWVH